MKGRWLLSESGSTQVSSQSVLELITIWAVMYHQRFGRMLIWRRLPCFPIFYTFVQTLLTLWPWLLTTSALKYLGLMFPPSNISAPPPTNFWQNINLCFLGLQTQKWKIPISFLIFSTLPFTGRWHSLTRICFKIGKPVHRMRDHPDHKVYFYQ